MARKTYQQYQDEIQRLQREAEQIRKKESSEAAAKIREAIKVYGFTVEDLFGSRRSSGKKSSNSQRKKPAKAKFADDAGNTWSGRGPRPAWFKAALEAGKKAEELLVA